MAQQIVTTLTSDVSGVAADESVEFGLDGQTFAIDLTTKEADSLRKALSNYVGVARKASRPTATATRSRRTPDASYSAPAVRKWAESQEPAIVLSARGRIPADVVQAFKDAGN